MNKVELGDLLRHTTYVVKAYDEGINANLVETTGEGVLPAGSFLVGNRLFQSGL